MRTIAIASQKGGAGKTTTAVNLAATAAELGHRPLVIDLDAQCSASAWLNYPTQDRDLFDLMTGSSRATLQELARPTSAPGVDLIPGSPWMMGLDKATATDPGASAILRDALQDAPRGRWTVTILDTPPQLGAAAIAGLMAVREVIVPVATHALSIAGLAGILQTIDGVRRLNKGIKLRAIVPCRADLRTNLANDIIEQLRGRFPETTTTVIRESVRLAEAPAHHEPITVYAPDSAGAEDYRALARELVGTA